MFRISLINLCQKNIKSSYNIGRQVLFLNRFNSTMSTKIGKASCKGKRVDLGGRRIIKKKKKNNRSRSEHNLVKKEINTKKRHLRNIRMSAHQGSNRKCKQVQRPTIHAHTRTVSTVALQP